MVSRLLPSYMVEDVTSKACNIVIHEEVTEAREP